MIAALAVFFGLGFALACLLTAPRMHELESENWELRRKVAEAGR